MKKTTFLLLLLSVALLFISCEGDTNTQPEATIGNEETVAETVTTTEVTSDEETVAETVTTAEVTSDEETVEETVTTAEVTSDEETVAETVTTAEVTSDEETVITEQPIETDEVTEPDTSIKVEETSQVSEETTEEEIINTKYKVLEVGSYDNLSGANHHTDIKLSSETYINQNTETLEKFSVNGYEYELKYFESNKGYLYYDNSDCYNTITADAYIRIDINKFTNDVDFYMYAPKKNMYDGTDKNKLSQDECEKIAREYLNKYVNVDEYKLTLVQYNDLIEYGGGIYTFGFLRSINGIIAMDGATIVVTVYGDVVVHNFECLGQLEDATVPTKEELSDMKVAIDAKVNSIYANVKKLYAVEYEIRDEYLIMLEDGKYAMEYVVDVNLTPNDPEGLKLIEKISLLVYV